MNEIVSIQYQYVMTLLSSQAPGSTNTNKIAPIASLKANRMNQVHCNVGNREHVHHVYLVPLQLAALHYLVLYIVSDDDHVSAKLDAIGDYLVVGNDEQDDMSENDNVRDLLYLSSR